MKWITTKVIPLATRNYPRMQMVLVMDNVPYHHVHVIQSLASFSKKSTVNIIKEHGINYVLLPLTNDLISLLPEQIIGMCVRTFSGGRTAVVVLLQILFHSF